VSHDLAATVVRQGRVNEKQEVLVSRVATVGLGIVAILLGIAFEKQNIAYMVGLAFAVAASANFPPLILSMYWKGLTTRGAVTGGLVGLVSAVTLTVLSPGIWVSVIGYKQAVFPYTSPALFSMPLAFFVTWVVSLTDRSADAKRASKAFEGQLIRSQTGIGAEAAAAH
jgi:cation/acetate symporter